MSDKIAKSLLTLIVLIVPAVFVIILVHLTRESWQAITQIGVSLFNTSGV